MPRGAIAQLVVHCLCEVDVSHLTPLISTLKLECNPYAVSEKLVHFVNGLVGKTTRLQIENNKKIQTYVLAADKRF
jgi:hypothetical protein